MKCHAFLWFSVYLIKHALPYIIKYKSAISAGASFKVKFRGG